MESYQKVCVICMLVLIIVSEIEHKALFHPCMFMAIYLFIYFYLFIYLFFALVLIFAVTGCQYHTA